jgi:hypothetical protein
MIGGFCAPLLHIAASEVSFAHPAWGQSLPCAMLAGDG